MKKDIFIDNSIASKHFSNPIDDEFKKLIDWILSYNKDEENDAFLVITPFLLKEYNESNRNANSKTNITRIIDDLTKQDRLIRFSKKEIEAFKQDNFSKKTLKSLKTSETKDINHIPAVLMSDRKMALTEDNNFFDDLNSFKNVIVKKRPEELEYE